MKVTQITWTSLKYIFYIEYIYYLHSKENILDMISGLVGSVYPKSELIF